MQIIINNDGSVVVEKAEPSVDGFEVNELRLMMDGLRAESFRVGQENQQLRKQLSDADKLIGKGWRIPKRGDTVVCVAPLPPIPDDGSYDELGYLRKYPMVVGAPYTVAGFSGWSHMPKGMDDNEWVKVSTYAIVIMQDRQPCAYPIHMFEPA
jgi:hypothetical protein